MIIWINSIYLYYWLQGLEQNTIDYSIYFFLPVAFSTFVDLFKYLFKTCHWCWRYRWWALSYNSLHIRKKSRQAVIFVHMHLSNYIKMSCFSERKSSYSWMKDNEHALFSPFLFRVNWILWYQNHTKIGNLTKYIISYPKTWNNSYHFWNL